MTRSEIITSWINKNVADGLVGKSNYLVEGDCVVRIANHEPVKANFEMFNQDCKKIVFIFFANDGFNDDKVESIVSEYEYDYECTFAIIDESNTISEYDKICISRLVD